MVSDERREVAERLCGKCAHFSVLDVKQGHRSKWFGVCCLELERDLDAIEMLDWIYQEGRHGEDDCERPDEWFDEG